MLFTNRILFDKFFFVTKQIINFLLNGDKKMKNKTLIVAVVMGCFLLSGCGSNFVEDQIAYETENNFVVEFARGTEVTEDVLSQMEASTSSSVMLHPYENFYVFENATDTEKTYAQLEQTCEELKKLDYVKNAHPQWNK